MAKLEIVRGDTAPFTVAVTDPTTRQPWPLDGYSCRMVLAVGSVVVSKTGSVTNASGGLFAVVFSSDDTATLGIGQATAWAIVVSPQNVKTTVAIVVMPVRAGAPG